MFRYVYFTTISYSALCYNKKGFIFVGQCKFIIKMKQKRNKILNLLSIGNYSIKKINNLYC